MITSPPHPQLINNNADFCYYTTAKQSLKGVCMSESTYVQSGGRVVGSLQILQIELLPHFSSNAHDQAHTHWSYGEDVQDIFLFKVSETVLPYGSNSGRNIMDQTTSSIFEECLGNLAHTFERGINHLQWYLQDYHYYCNYY